MRRALVRVAALIALVFTPAMPAYAVDVSNWADLGPAATTGAEAAAGFEARTRTLHLSMACGSEFEFIRGFAWASRFGKKGDDPATQNFNEKDLAAWPLTLMLGKAAVLKDSAIEPIPSEVGRPICRHRLGTFDEVRDRWAPLASDRMMRPEETPVDLVNRIYGELFIYSGDSINAACQGPAYQQSEGGPAVAETQVVYVSLTRACLARQIRVVMSDPRHGPWHEEGGVVTPELPGTSADKLPCLSEWKFKVKGMAGDWDMGVIEYTRLAHLLYAVHETRHGVSHEIAAALETLNKRFLTLRSSPEQGATARESFNLATSCGNLPNQSGSAIDTVNGTGDEGVGRYNEDGKDALDGTTFWEDLLRFLAILALIVAALVAAAIVGAIVGAIVAAAAGAGAGAAAAAAVAAVIGIVVIGSLLFGSIEETENHLLMQNSSRYLKNKLMMAELSQQGHREEFETIAELNEELREWLLERMQSIAEDDFVEYNAKPYARLSHFALLNLIDFACDIQWDYALAAQMQSADARCDAKDQAIVTAAAAVFDLSSAKAAVGSLGGRRLIPYRRLVVENQRYYNGRALAELVGGADTMVAALQVWTGELRYAPFTRATWGTFGQLIFYSTSRYRPDTMILDIAVNKTTPRQQQYRHGTREAYSSGDGWLITAGGTDERAAQGLTYPGFTIYALSPTDDRGVGVPTTLMTDTSSETIVQPPRFATVRDFLRFDGKEVDWGTDDDGNKLVSFSNNNCVTYGFACGLRPRKPFNYSEFNCSNPISDKFTAIDSTQCPGIGTPAGSNRGIYIAFYDHNGEWGFFEVASRTEFPTLSDFIAKVRERNSAHSGDWVGKDADDEITYVTTDGRELKFTPEDEDFGADRRACGVVNHEDDSRYTISDVPASQSANCLSVGRRIFINLDDEMNPVRRAENGASLDDLF